MADTLELIPASVINESTVDQARFVPGAAPNFGQQFLPHIATIVGRTNFASRAYSNYSDEALYHSFQNAEIMRNEPAIMECVEARMRAPALLNWHVVPMDTGSLAGEKKDQFEEDFRREYKHAGNRWDHEEVARKMTVILNHTRNFMQYRYNLMNAIWYGRYLVQAIYRPKLIGDRYVPYIHSWEPRHGDKLVFRYDDGSREELQGQVGVRVGWTPGGMRDNWNDAFGGSHKHIEATEQGLVYWLNPIERSTCCVHRHIIEDGSFDYPLKAGSINGIGIRSRIYWTWWAYQECLRLLLEYTERSALGIEVWRYPAHNAAAEERAKQAAHNRGAPGRHVLLFPVPAGENADMYNVEIIEPGLGGLQELQSVLHEFFEWKFKRYILGQTLSSEAGSTGMGSGVAEAHLATLSDIIRFDSTNLEESMTFDQLRTHQLACFPGSDDIFLKFSIDTESDDSARKLEAWQAAYSMGLPIRAADLYKLLGGARPQKDEETLLRPDPMAALGGAM